jgi:CubicO group peptidase (beta-lactamase class C family)
MKEGQMVYSCSQGLADFKQKTKMDIDTRQHFGSVSKQFTAMSILLLAEEGKLNLDEDIRTYIPNFPVCYFNGEKVTLTIRHVLEMRSGLPEVLAYAFLAGKRDQDLTAEQKMDPLFKQETIELAFAPGTDMHYCNTNYYILPEIVYRLTNQTIKEYADSNIFKKLGMDSTSFIDPNQPVFEQSVKGYGVVPKEEVQECTTHNETWGPCGVIGTPRDMVLWDANFTNNRLGKKLPQLIETFTALPKPPLKKGGLEYGNGLFVGLLGKYKIERHAGAIEGFTTEFLRITHAERPQEHLSFFIASNRNDDQQHTVNSIAMKLAQIWMEEQIFPSEMGAPPPMQEEPESLTTKSELTSYQGKYECSILGASYECVIGEREGNVGLILKKLKDPHVKEDKDHEIFFLEKHPKDKDAFFSRQESSAEFHFQPGKGFTFTDRSQGIINLRFLKQP